MGKILLHKQIWTRDNKKKKMCTEKNAWKYKVNIYIKQIQTVQWPAAAATADAASRIHIAHSGLVLSSETCDQCVSYFYFPILYLFSHRTRRYLHFFFLGSRLYSHFVLFPAWLSAFFFLRISMVFSSNAYDIYCWWILFTIFFFFLHSTHSHIYT